MPPAAVGVGGTTAGGPALTLGNLRFATPPTFGQAGQRTGMSGRYVSRATWSYPTTGTVHASRQRRRLLRFFVMKTLQIAMRMVRSTLHA